VSPSCVLTRVSIAVIAASGLTGCKKPAPRMPPPPPVSIVTAEPHQVALPVEFMGTVEASRSVEVRSQVTGVIMARPYEEGSMVHAGDVLFRIDTTEYAAAYRSALGRLADAQARQANALLNVNRLRPLLADSAVARRDVEDAEAELARASATVEDARGAVDQAKKNYDETTVRAELTGRVGRANFVVGDRVTGSSDVLTTIDAYDPAYVTFRPSAQQVEGWKRVRDIARALMPGGTARVQVSLPDGSVLPRTGRIEFVDPAVDPATGTQAYRATFDNADRALVPGQFVRVRLLGLVRDSTITVPERAVLESLGRQYVYVVLPGDSVVTRDVVTGDLLEGSVTIAHGLAAGDRVVVDGLQKIRPGARVTPQPLDSTGTAVAAPAGAPPGGAAPASRGARQ